MMHPFLYFFYIRYHNYHYSLFSICVQAWVLFHYGADLLSYYNAGITARRETYLKI